MPKRKTAKMQAATTPAPALSVFSSAPKYARHPSRHMLSKADALGSAELAAFRVREVYLGSRVTSGAESSFGLPLIVGGAALGLGLAVISTSYTPQLRYLWLLLMELC